MKRTVYRVRATGRFAPCSTWRRSKAHGGTRYVRQRIEVKPKPKAPAKPRPTREVEEEGIRAEIRRLREVEEIEEEEEFEPFEIEGSADYEEPE